MHPLLRKIPLSCLVLAAWAAGLVPSGCSTPRYIIVSEHELDKQVQKYRKVPRARYVTIPFYYDEYIQKRPIPEEDTLVYHLASLIKQGEFAACDRMLQQAAAVTSRSRAVLDFCQGLCHFFKGEYQAARDLFNSVTDSRYACLALVLRADCCYELARSADFDSQELLKEYQKALECTQDEVQGKIIHLRMKMVTEGK